MQSVQHPLNSGFGKESSVDDVLAGVDLTDRLAVITGAYSGIGFELTRALTDRGATVIAPARRPDLAIAQLRGLPRVRVAALDLADLGSVSTFSADLLNKGAPIDLLINNAGVMAPPETRVAHGWELQFATNHLGHYALANHLWPLLTADGGARVIAVSSRGHKFGPIRWDDLDFSRGYDPWQAYGQSKRANILFAIALDQIGRDDSVRGYSLHPGGIRTNLQRHMSHDDEIRLGWYDDDGNLAVTFKTPAQGAATTAWAATTPQLTNIGGVYCEDCDIAHPVSPGTNPRTGVDSDAIDPDAADRLWQISAQLTGVDCSAT